MKTLKSLALASVLFASMAAGLYATEPSTAAPATPPPTTPAITEIINATKVETGDKLPPPTATEIKAAVQDRITAFREARVEFLKKQAELRDKLKNATTEERAAIREEFMKNAKELRDALKAAQSDFKESRQKIMG